MSKDTKDIKDIFHSELEKATLKELQEAITWRLGDIQKSFVVCCSTLKSLGVILGGGLNTKVL